MIGITVLMLLAMAPVTAAAALPSFSLTVSDQTVSEGQQVSVKVTGSNLSDVYGYELKLSFDDTLLSYTKTISALSGFSVPPKDAEGGKLIFAHTKIGSTAGLSGTVDLATITFTVLGRTAGEAIVTLDSVKLVDSSLNATDTAAKVSASIDIAAASEMKPAAFTDLDGHWAQQAIERAAALGIMKGYPDGTFRPKGEVTRAEFAAMITRAFTLKSAAGVTSEFTDAAKLPGWAKEHIAEAAAAGIVTGYADGSFRPNALITRTEMTAVLARVLELQPDGNAKLSFGDKDSIPAWARPAVASAVKAGIVKGSSGNRFSPASSASRAEAGAVIIAGLDYLAARQ
ncbi:hypothetical protein DNH61_03765 [Paenibacillus sambharensis]|uniref:SLH domain-containing protein n=2 Tax=Paenibacillus sambharensis TaxID=1803190 RepID=A0A2W1LEI7_9BACL|nr:hypothetical protein DNH61_03765 [Paenibacillus sambharensis]